jgi:putative membrane protein
MRLHHLMVALALAGLAGCDSDRDTTNDGRYEDPVQNGGSRNETNTGAGTAQPNSTAARAGYPATRALSILHAKNAEEIELGRLAEQNAGSDAVRDYGRMLVQHHQDNDSKVQSLARELNLTLTEPSQMQQTLMAEKKQATPGLPDQSPKARLSLLRGNEFDRAFADQMVNGHREAIDMMTRERGKVQNARVRELIDETLPALREHLSRAEQLPRG